MLLQDITIRNTLKTGDLGSIVSLHGIVYNSEYQYNLHFESYVAAGVHEFYMNYDPVKDRVWICEYENNIAGMAALHYKNDGIAHLRFFLIRPEYRGIGLGKKLMRLFMDCLEEKNYRHATLLTISELKPAIHLYQQLGFQLIEETPSEDFGRRIILQRYEWKGN